MEVEVVFIMKEETDYIESVRKIGSFKKYVLQGILAELEENLGDTVYFSVEGLMDKCFGSEMLEPYNGYNQNRFKDVVVIREFFDDIGDLIRDFQEETGCLFCKDLNPFLEPEEYLVHCVLTQARFIFADYINLKSGEYSLEDVVEISSELMYDISRVVN